MDSDFLRLARRVKDVEGGYLNTNGGVVSGDLDVTGTLTNNSHTVWNAGNGGTGSGLDADTVDGVHASGLLKNKAASAQVIGSGAVYDLPRVIAYGNGASAGAAGISLLRENAYAVHFGLDTDNVLKVGGWSMGNTAYNIWHSGNMPYEAGGWTPILYGSTTAGSPTYISRYGVYRRVGSVIHIMGQIRISAKGGMAGELRIGGLPYTANMAAGGVVGGTGDTSSSRITLHLDGGTNMMRICVPDGFLIDTNVGNTFVIWGFSMSYSIG